MDTNSELPKRSIRKAFLVGLLIGLLPVLFALHKHLLTRSELVLKSKVIANQGIALVNCYMLSCKDRDDSISHIMVLFRYYSEVGLEDRSAAAVLFYALIKCPELDAALVRQCPGWYERMKEKHIGEELMPL